MPRFKKFIIRFKKQLPIADWELILYSTYTVVSPLAASITLVAILLGAAA
jgi:hypothetical protein